MNYIKICIRSLGYSSCNDGYIGVHEECSLICNDGFVNCGDGCIADTGKDMDTLTCDFAISKALNTIKKDAESNKKCIDYKASLIAAAPDYCWQDSYGRVDLITN